MNAVEVNGLAYSYPDGKQALRGVTFSVADGERVALIGPNGAGKSTLLVHLNGILPDPPAREPAVRIFGSPLVKDNLAGVRRDVGLLFQDPDDQLFCPTVWEDVAFGPAQMGMSGAVLDARVEASLSRVGLAGFGERTAHHLSRGERRRVCLAGLLACEARVLALDEPTSDLDPRARRELKAILTGLPVAQVIATHDLEFVVEVCSRAILLDGGSVVAQGRPADLLADEALMLEHGLDRPHILRHSHPH